MAELFPPDAGRDKHGGNGKPKAAQRAHRTPEAALAKTIEKRGKPTRHWVYRNADGSEAMRVYRFDFVDPEAGDPDKEYRPVHHTAAGWVSATLPARSPLSSPRPARRPDNLCLRGREGGRCGSLAWPGCHNLGPRCPIAREDGMGPSG